MTVLVTLPFSSLTTVESSGIHTAGQQSIALSDGQFVFGPNVEGFDLQQYLQDHASHLLPIYDSLIFWSAHPSLNPKLLLTLIELRTGLVTRAGADIGPHQDLFGLRPTGVNEQLERVAHSLTGAYYQHLREITPLPVSRRPLLRLHLKDRTGLTLGPEINAATYGIAYSLAAMGETTRLPAALDADQSASFYQTYRRLFPDDDPLDDSNVINIFEVPPVDLFQLPYLISESWTFNGVHHWSGSYGTDWSSIDMSDGWPGWGADTSNTWVAAAAPGSVLRYSDCWLRLTHSDGWMTAYYHLENPQVSTGDVVTYDQRLANYANTLAEATCSGGFSTGPHLHFALLLNGAYVALNETILSGWTVHATCSVAYDTNPDCMYLEQDGVRVYGYIDPLENQGVMDTIPPTVTLVSSNPDTGDGELSPGEITSARITQLEVTFREFVHDPLDNSDSDDVTNPANYHVITNGTDNLFQTGTCGATQGDDGEVAVNSVAYLSTTQTATLSVNGGKALPADGYRLLVCGSTSILDLADNSLDGSGDGTGGDDFTRDFVIALGAGYLPLPPITVYGQPDFTSGAANNGGLGPTSLNEPSGIAVDSGGGVYLTDSENHRVLYYPAGSTTAARVYGQPDFTSGSENNGGVGAISLNRPLDVAVDGTGVYIADADNNRVLFYSGTSATATRVYGQPGFDSNDGNHGGLSAASLDFPTGVAAANGGVYIVDNSNNRVLYYPGTSTTATRVYGQAGSFDTNEYNKNGVSASSLANPSDIAVSSAGVYIADEDNDRVLYYSGDSTTASRVYGQPDLNSGGANNGGISASTLYAPLDVSVDSAGGVYVADSSNHRALYYGSGSTVGSRVYGQPDFASRIANNGGLGAPALNLPMGLATHGVNRLYISDNNNHRMLGYSLYQLRFPLIHRK